MDISEIITKNREVELLHPKTDEPLGIHIELRSMHDKRVKLVERKIRDEILKTQSKGKAMKSVDIEANEKRLIEAAMVGWRWEADEQREIEQPSMDGEEHPEFTPKNIKRLLSWEWARDTIDEELGNVADFFAT